MFKYRIKPKYHIRGKYLKRFYRDLMGYLPENWTKRPTLVLFRKGEGYYDNVPERRYIQGNN